MTLSRRRFLTGGVALGSALAAGRLAGPPRAAAAGSMAVSFGKVDITPPPGLPLGGYNADIPRLATGTYMPLWARCTVLWDNGTPNVIVTADVLGFGPATHEAIRARVSALGVARPDFVLTATHTHNGPVLTEPIPPYILYNVDDISDIEAYTDDLVTMIGDLVASTLADTPIDCTLDYQVLDEDFSYNRELLGYVERDVPTLIARSLGGEPLAVLFGYGCHPVAAGVLDVYDPDYAGEAVSIVEDLSGCFAQFVLGAAGDQDPSGEHDIDRRNALGADLGVTVLNSLDTPGRPVSGPLVTAYRDITLPLDIVLNPDNLATVRSFYVNRLSTTGEYVRRHAEVMIDQIDDGSFATEVPLPVQTWRLGGDPDLRIVFSGGELVSGYAAYLRNNYGDSDGIWVNGYANEIPAYIPSDELLYYSPGRYYACGWSPDYPGIAGGAMCVYGWLGHFLGRAPGTTTVGVEQILIDELTSML